MKKVFAGIVVPVLLTIVILEYVFLSEVRFQVLLKWAVEAVALISTGFAVIWFLIRIRKNPKQVTTVLVNLSMIFLFTAVSLSAAEFFLRFFFRDVTTTVHGGSYFTRKWLKSVRKNALGFREREVMMPKPEDLYRIAVIGDSLAYGQGISEHDRFSNMIENELNQRYTPKRYEVLNFARPGAETVDHLDFLRNGVIGTEPDFILLQWYINDVQGRGKSYAFSPPTIVPHVLRRNSVFFYLVHRELGAFQTALASGSFAEYMHEQFGNPDSPASIAAHNALATLVQTCRDAGIPLAMVLFSDSYIRGETDLDFLLDRVLHYCEQEALLCIDTRPIFRPFQHDRQLWANRLDPHPNALANRLVADELLNSLGPNWQPNQ